MPEPNVTEIRLLPGYTARIEVFDRTGDLVGFMTWICGAPDKNNALHVVPTAQEEEAEQGSSLVDDFNRHVLSMMTGR